MVATAAVLAAAMAFVACSSDDDSDGTALPAGQGTVTAIAQSTPAPSATPAVAETPTPVATEPTPTPATVPATVTPAPTVSPIDLSSLTVPVCRTVAGNANGVGFGTIPHATPTPIPRPGSSGQASGAEAREFVNAAGLLAAATASATEAADSAWAAATSPDDFARVVLFESRRLSQLCSALALVPLTTDGVTLVTEVASALNGHRDYLSEVAEALRDGADAGFSSPPNREETAARLSGLPERVDQFGASVGAGAGNSLPFSIVNPLLGVSFGVPAGWLPVRNGIDIVLAAPVEQQVYSVDGLGPEPWRLGTALRVRRFRNSPPWGLADAAATLDSLYVRFGGPVSSEPAEAGGHPAVLRVYRNPGTAWDTIVAAAVVDDSTYLFELGCPANASPNVSQKCAAAMDGFLDSAEISG